jgi:hypothetical protein
MIMMIGYYDTSYFRLKFEEKICYFYYCRHFLPLNHSFKLDSNNSKGNTPSSNTEKGRLAPTTDFPKEDILSS